MPPFLPHFLNLSSHAEKAVAENFELCVLFLQPNEIFILLIYCTFMPLYR